MKNIRITLSLALTAVLTYGLALGRTEAGGSRYPQIVKSVSLTAQTAQVPMTTLVTAQENGLYRVSFYGLVTATQGGQFVLVPFYWTDDGGHEQDQFEIPVNPFGCYAEGAVNTNPCSWNTMVRLNAGSTLQGSTYFYPRGSSFTYDLYVTVERMQ